MGRFFRLIVAILICNSVALAQPVSSSKVNIGAVGGNTVTTTLPVSGTLGVTGTVGISGTAAVTQSGTWTVQPGNTANTTAWKVDGSAVTQPVSAATLPLPTGAALDASVTGLQVTQGSTTSGAKGGLTLGAVTTASPTYTTAQSSPMSLDTSGRLRVNVAGNDATLTVSGVGAEDSAAFGGENAFKVLGFRNDAGTGLTSNDNDWGNISINSKGSVNVDIATRNQYSSSSALLKQEDDASAHQDAGVAIFALRQSVVATTGGTDGDYSLFNQDTRGLEFVNPWGSDAAEFFHTQLTSDITDTTATTVQAANATKKHHLVNVTCTNTSAIATRVDIIDNATVVWSLMLKAGDGAQQTFNPPLVAAATNTVLKVQAATTASATRCGMNGFDSATQ